MKSETTKTMAGVGTMILLAGMATISFEYALRQFLAAWFKLAFSVPMV